MKHAVAEQASERLVATVGLLIGILAATTWVTFGDLVGAESPPAAMAGANEVRPSGRVERLAARTTLSVMSRGCSGELVGSGVVTRGGLLVTAAHVVGGSRSVTVANGEEMAVASPMLSALEADVASGPVPRGWEAVSRAGADPAVGTSVVLASRARGLLRVRGARVDAYLRGTGPDDPPLAMRLDVAVSPGESGGPVLDATDGRFLGIVYASEHVSGRALVIPVTQLSAALGGPSTVSGC